VRKLTRRGAGYQGGVGFCHVVFLSLSAAGITSGPAWGCG
jgi:hypothetical protein